MGIPTQNGYRAAMITGIATPAIPRTSTRSYLSGITALNVPAPENTGGDWHFHEAFRDSRARLFVAGEGSDFVNTNALLGTYGIHECSQILRMRGIKVPEGMLVYSANHYRAILDLVIRRARQESNVPQFLSPHDFLDNEQELAELVRELDEISPKLSLAERQFVDLWRNFHQI